MFFFFVIYFIFIKFVFTKKSFMKLEKYISDLLYRYDLVIIPDFGGVVTRKKPASYNKDSFVFTPPHKELSFNELLKNNDGLLTNYVAEVRNISYEEAAILIKKQVIEWKNILQKDRRLKLEQIGIFNLTSGQNLFFFPLTSRNYLADAYGLTSFIRKPLSKPSIITPKVEEKAVVSQVDENTTASKRKEVRKKVITHKSTRISTPWWRYAAVLVTGITLMGAIAYQFNNQTNVQEPVFQKASFVLPTDFPAIVIEEKQNKTPDSDALKENKNIQKYFIISGAFRNKQNAKKKVKSLQEKRYKASIVGKNKRGLYLVSYSSFESMEEAKKQLSLIRKIHPQAWIYKQP